MDSRALSASSKFCSELNNHICIVRMKKSEKLTWLNKFLDHMETCIAQETLELLTPRLLMRPDLV
jgi:hypothetical protein